MGIRSDIVAVGLAKQTAKGSPAATPIYGFGVRGGKAFNLEVAQDYEAITLPGGASDRFAPDVIRTEVLPAMRFTTRAWARMIGLLLFGALGTDTVTGPVSSVYTHADSPALDLPWLTAWAKYGTGQFVKMQDCKIDSLGLSWSERDPWEAQVDILGLSPAMDAVSWAATNDESTQTRFGPNAGTFQLDTGSAVAVAAKVKGASCVIANNLVPVPLASSVLPADLHPGDQTVEGSIVLVPDDLTDWRKIVTGSGAGGAVRETPIYGSFSLKAVIDANTDLTLASLRAGFLGDLPDADPGGGPAEFEAAYSVVRPTDGSAAFTATLRNAVSSY